MATSFTDDSEWLFTADLVAYLCQRWKGSGVKAVEWWDHNHVIFDNVKEEFILFTKRRRWELKRRIAEVRAKVHRHTIDFNTEITWCLWVYLNKELQFRVLENLILEKAKRVEDWVRNLSSTRGLTPGLVQKIQIAAVQTVVHNISNIWWNSWRSLVLGVPKANWQTKKSPNTNTLVSNDRHNSKRCQNATSIINTP